jgi:Leucine-rich repeat (LRR) protein
MVREKAAKQTEAFKYSRPDEAYRAARRRIVNNALRRKQLTLDLSNFGLVDLPAEIEQLTSLRSLNISNNQLTQLPSEIGGLELSNNQLTELPNDLRDGAKRTRRDRKDLHLDQ